MTPPTTKEIVGSKLRSHVRPSRRCSAHARACTHTHTRTHMHSALEPLRQASGYTTVLSNAVHPGIVATDLVTANADANFGLVLGAIIKVRCA